MNSLYAIWWENDDNTFQFQIKAANHEALATSQRYKSKQAMLDTIELLKHGSSTIEVKEGKKNKENI